MIWILAIIIAVLVVLGILYNNLVRKRTLVDEGWSGIDIELKKRWDLVPNLVSTVQGYAAHEREVFEKVTQARAAAMGAKSVGERVQNENMLSDTLKSLFAVAENYPDLKANEGFLNLQNQLSALETTIENARRYYNGAVREYTVATQTFPGVIVAGLFGFKAREFFQLPGEQERAVPKVSFDQVPPTAPAAQNGPTAGA